MNEIEPIETERPILESLGTELLAALSEGDIEAAQRLVGYRIPAAFALLRRPILKHRLGRGARHARRNRSHHSCSSANTTASMIVYWAGSVTGAPSGGC